MEMNLATSVFQVHSGKLTWRAGKWTRIENVFPLESGDIPASYVRLPEGIILFFEQKLPGCLGGKRISSQGLQPSRLCQRDPSEPLFTGDWWGDQADPKRFFWEIKAAQWWNLKSKQKPMKLIPKMLVFPLFWGVWGGNFGDGRCFLQGGWVGGPSWWGLGGFVILAYLKIIRIIRCLEKRWGPFFVKRYTLIYFGGYPPPTMPMK